MIQAFQYFKKSLMFLKTSFYLIYPAVCLSAFQQLFAMNFFKNNDYLVLVVVTLMTLFFWTVLVVSIRDKAFDVGINLSKCLRYLGQSFFKLLAFEIFFGILPVMLVYYLGANGIPDLSSDKGGALVLISGFIVIANFILIFAKHNIIFNRSSVYRASLDSFAIVKSNFRQIIYFLVLILMIQFYFLVIFVPLQMSSNILIKAISVFVDGTRFYIMTTMITLFYLDTVSSDSVNVSV